MATQLENSAVRSVFTEIAVTIVKAARNGRVLSTAVEAARIAHEYPDSELTESEISEALFRKAVEHRLNIDSSQ